MRFVWISNKPDYVRSYIHRYILYEFSGGIE
jgi:hypothetical protein